MWASKKVDQVIAERQSCQPGGGCQQCRFRHHLANQAQPARAKRHTQRELVAAVFGASEQQAGDVRASDQQDERGDREQRQGEVFDRAAARPALGQRGHLPARVGLRKLLRQAGGDGRQLRLGFLQRHSGSEAREDLVIPVSAHRQASPLAGQLDPGVDRDPDVRHHPRLGAPKPPGQHAGHEDGLAVQDDRASRQRRIAIELLPPERIAQHDGESARRLHLRFGERAS